MGDTRRSVLGMFKESATSLLIKRLTPDSALLTVQAAIQEKEALDNGEGGSNEGEEDVKGRLFHVPRMVAAGSHFAYTLPEKRPHYRPILQSRCAIQELSLDQVDPLELEQVLDGSKVLYNESIFPYSLAYAGFQFGDFAGQLGDGRVVNLFDIKDHHGKLQTLQLKGSGRTPFSRFGDGKAVLRASIREFIISEALHHIGMPSTRALQLSLLPGTKAYRSTYEPCAVICRYSPSWLRLGNFDLLRWRPHLPGLVQLADFCIDDVFQNGKDFPHQLDLNSFNVDYFPDEDSIIRMETDDPVTDDSSNHIDDITKYDQFFRHVCNLNAECVAYWQAYGFLNGVLNTDNTSILGISMDYGPFSFLDKFDPTYTPNHDDFTKRYSFENQPDVIWWNLTQFAQAIAVLIGSGGKYMDRILSQDRDILQKLTHQEEHDMVKRANMVIRFVGREFKFRFIVKYIDLMSKRLGIDLNLETKYTNAEQLNKSAQICLDFCSNIIEPLTEILRKTKVDYNNFFVNFQNYEGTFFSEVQSTESIKYFEALDKDLIKIFFNDKQYEKLATFYELKFEGSHEKLSAFLFEDAGETKLLVEYLEDLHNWLVSFVQYSREVQVPRREMAKHYNPLFIPRSWVFDEVIQDITVRQKDLLDDPGSKLDTSMLDKLYLMSVNPYDPSKWDASLRPELAARWANFENKADDDENGKFMQQASCSS